MRVGYSDKSASANGAASASASVASAARPGNKKEKVEKRIMGYLKLFETQAAPLGGGFSCS